MQTANAALMMTLREVKDPQSGLVAYTYLAPEGWEITDEVYWDRNNRYNPAHLNAHCYNNDGLTIQVKASYTNRYWANPMGNSGNNLPPADITAALKTYLQWLRGTTIQFTEATVLASSQEPGMQGYNNSTIIYYQNGRIRGNYEKNGVHFDEILYGSIWLMHTKQPPDFTGFFSEDITWEVNDLFLSCASHHRNPETGVSTALTIKSSVKQTLPFYNCEKQTVELLRQEYHQRNFQAGQISKITSQTNQEISDMINKSYRERQKQQDLNHEQFCNYIRDVDRYNNGSGTEYQLPAGYDSAWVNDKGTVLLIDSNTPDPNYGSYETWTKLNRKKYS